MHNSSGTDKFDNKCYVCGKASTLKCSSCKQVVYCGKIHQKLDWKTHKYKCKSIKIESSVKLGRYLVATRNILMDEVMLNETPLVIGPKFVDPGPVCLGCLKPIQLTTNYSQCGKCLWPVCSKACSGLVSGYHQEECGILAKRKFVIGFDYRYEVITPLRCLILKNVNPEKWNLLMSLESHMQHRMPGTEVYWDVEKVADYLMGFLIENIDNGNRNKNEYRHIIHRICGILEVNSLDVPVGNDIALSAIYESFSLIEHNCSPNIKLSFSNHELTVKASANVARNEHISTMYTNCLWGTKLRQDHLAATKYFRCYCARCCDPTEFGTNFSALKCLKENNDGLCPGYLLPVTPLLQNSVWKCSHCSLEKTSEEVESTTEQLGSEIDRITEEAGQVSVKRLEEMLTELHSLLHTNHYHCFALKHILIQAYGHQDGYKHDQLSNSQLAKKQDYCRQLLSTLNVLDPTSARTSLYTAIVYYELASVILEGIKRKNTNNDNRSEVEIERNEAKFLTEKAVQILKDEVYPSPGFAMSQCCQQLFAEIVE